METISMNKINKFTLSPIEDNLKKCEAIGVLIITDLKLLFFKNFLFLYKFNISKNGFINCIMIVEKIICVF